ncbi:nitroreductase family protein [Paraprevotella clara]|jgi:nitroreductase family protein|uniref:nitroreductase family protein n=1 Tax=Paraprevotella clara TaxID=454154 RepID=UPI003AB8838C
MSIKDYLKNSRTVLFFRLLHEKFQEVVLLTKYIANGNRLNDKDKLLTDLAIRTHAIEKGMSIGNVKVGFGKPKVMSLLRDMQLYLSLGGNKGFVSEACSVINKYIAFNESIGADMATVKDRFMIFCKENKVEMIDKGGIYLLDRESTVTKLNSSFDIFSQSRFSVRDFGTDKISFVYIERALSIAEKSPSACNRQSWRIYVYSDAKLRNKIFSLQGGCNGFCQDMQYAILICGDIRGYNINELSQVYVDGGIYAMNLLYALHFEGVAAIPLTMGHKQKKLKEIKLEMDIPDNEVPVLLIGVGAYKDKYKVAVSVRRDYHNYTFIR